MSRTFWAIRSILASANFHLTPKMTDSTLTHKVEAEAAVEAAAGKAAVRSQTSPSNPVAARESLNKMPAHIAIIQVRICQ